MANGSSPRRTLAAVLLGLIAAALMATSPPRPAEITGEARTDIRFDDGHVQVLTLVARLSEQAFAQPFDRDPSVSITIDTRATASGSEPEPLLRAEVRAVDPDGTVFGRPIRVLGSEYVDMLPYCDGNGGCEQRFRMVVERVGGGPETSAEIRVRATAEYEGDHGSEPDGATFKVALLDEPAGGDEIASGRAPAPTPQTEQPLVVRVVDEGWAFARPVQVSVTRVGDGSDDPVLVRVRPGATVQPQLRGGGDSRVLNPDAGAQPLCGEQESCPSQYSISFMFRGGDPIDATVEFFSSSSWLVERGGTSLPSVGSDVRTEVEGVVELTADQPVVDLSHVLTVGPEHLPASDDGRLGALLEVAAPSAAADGVRVTMGPHGYERVLTGERLEAAVSSWLAGQLDGQDFRAPVPVAFELDGDGPLRVSWRLMVAMDTLTWELPGDAQLVLEAEGAGG